MKGNGRRNTEQDWRCLTILPKELVYDDVEQSQEFLQDICTEIKYVKSIPHQDTAEITSMKIEFRQDFNKHTVKCYELYNEIMMHMIQGKRAAQGAELQRRRLEQEALQAQAKKQQNLCEVEESRYTDTEFSMEDKEV